MMPITMRARMWWILVVGLAAALASPAVAQTTGGASGASETSNPAPAATAAQAAPGTIELTPPNGPGGEEVRIVGSRLTPNAPVVVLGGTDPAQLAPLAGEEGEAQRMATGQQQEHVDTSGAFRSLTEVPDTVGYGSEFYFALQIGEQVTQPMAYRVEAREPQK